MVMSSVSDLPNCNLKKCTMARGNPIAPPWFELYRPAMVEVDVRRPTPDVRPRSDVRRRPSSAIGNHITGVYFFEFLRRKKDFKKIR